LYKNCRILAFEPIKKLADDLRKSAPRNVEVFEMAIGGINGKIAFHQSKFEETSSLVLPNLNSNWHKKKSAILGINPKKMYTEVQVEVRTLDSVISENRIEKISLLKIYVEGAELDVLLGAQNSLKQEIFEVIEVEVHDNGLRESNLETINNLLFACNYQQFAAIKHSFGNFNELIYVRRMSNFMNS
jgi:hypothetical protein